MVIGMGMERVLNVVLTPETILEPRRPFLPWPVISDGSISFQSYKSGGDGIAPTSWTFALSPVLPLSLPGDIQLRVR